MARRSNRDVPTRPYTDFATPLLDAASHYKDRFESLASYRSSESPFWDLCSGLFLQLCDSQTVVRLLTRPDAEPHRFPVQAGVVARSAIEAFGSVLYLADCPRLDRRERALDFGRDAFKHSQESLKKLQAAPYSNRPESIAFREAVEWGVERHARQLGLSTRQVVKYHKLPSWPSAGALSKDNILSPPLRSVFNLVYESWYPIQSRMAHPKSDALRGTMLMRGYGWPEDVSDLCDEATVCVFVCLASAMAEIERISPWGMPRPRSLRQTWIELVKFGDVVPSIFESRYAKL